MEVIIKSYEDDINFNKGKQYKGYIVLNDKMRNTANSWAGDYSKTIYLPDTLTNLRIYDYDDRMNNKIFKIAYMHENTEITFDIYCDSLLEILMYGVIKDGIILSEIIPINGAKLVLKNGNLHKEYIEKQNKKKEKASIPKIKNFIEGNVYKRDDTKYGEYMYLGKYDGKHVFQNFYKYGYDDTIGVNTYDLLIVKSPTFRVDIGITEISRDELIDIAINQISEQIQYSYWNADRLQENLEVLKYLKTRKKLDELTALSQELDLYKE